jgi:site-specific recombinase XerD
MPSQGASGPPQGVASLQTDAAAPKVVCPRDPDWGFISTSASNVVSIPRPYISASLPLLVRFLDLVDEYISILKAKTSPQLVTVRGNLFRLVGYLHYKGINIGPEQCTEDLFYHYRVALRRWHNPMLARKLSQNTLAAQFIVISGFYNWLRDKKGILPLVGNPSSFEKKARDLEARAISRDNIRDLFTEIQHSTSGYEKRLICETLYATAGRVSEVTKLVRGDINFNENGDLATVMFSRRKGGKSREVYLPAHLKEGCATFVGVNSSKK